MIEKQPANFLDAKMNQLISERLALRQRLANVDTEIGRLDLLMSGHPQPQATLPETGDFFWQRRINFDQTRAEQAMQQSDAKQMARPPYESLIQ